MTPQLRTVSRRQAGCFTRGQALQCGVTSAEIERYLLDGEWLPAMGQVLVLAGAPGTEGMQSWIAVLAVGGQVALAGCSAGRELGLDRVPLPPRPQLIVPNTRDPRDFPELDIRRVSPSQWAVMWRRGLPLTPAPMTIRDIAACRQVDLVRDIVQHALRRRTTTFASLAATLGRGREGSSTLRAVLEEVGPGFQVKWERMVFRAVLERGVRMTPQTEVIAPDGRKAFLDLGIPELKFGVEIDGFLNHMARFAADRRRARMLALDFDWTLAPYAVEEIAADLDAVADEIVAHIRRLERGLAA